MASGGVADARLAAAEQERQQEALLIAKYGGMRPKQSPRALLGKKASSKKCFDSADWVLAKEGRPGEAIEVLALDAPPEALVPKLEPGPPTPPRRMSNLGDA